MKLDLFHEKNMLLPNVMTYSGRKKTLSENGSNLIRKISSYKIIFLAIGYVMSFKCPLWAIWIKRSNINNNCSNGKPKCYCKLVICRFDAIVCQMTCLDSLHQKFFFRMGFE